MNVICGIAAISTTPTDRLATDALSRSLLRRIEVRGPHATGAAWTADGDVWFDKAALPAHRYVRMLPMPAKARTAILHTRYATQGKPENNDNNHPFALPGIVGVHNGIVTNDREIFRTLGVARTCETDSEAIFALLSYGGFSHPTEALAEVRGDAAVAWIETDDPDTLHLARLSGRPMALTNTRGGSLVMASTPTLLHGALDAAGVARDRRMDYDVPEGCYLRVTRGIIHEVVRFAPACAGVLR